MDVTLGNTAELADALAAAAASGAQTPLARWVNGRLVGVLASPADDTAEHLAIGVSALPAGVSTPAHNHEAEEIAIVIAGTGHVVISDQAIRVAVGDVVRTPPSAAHTTIADDTAPLVILWLYAPAGSEGRWLADDPVETVTHHGAGNAS